MDLAGVGTVSGNHGAGIFIEQGSNVHLNGATISNNTGDGVHIRWLSTADLRDFGGGPNTHGNTKHRRPGSIGPGTDPSRVIKGKKMPGHYCAERHTQIGLRVEKVDAERNLIYVRGAVAARSLLTEVVARERKSLTTRGKKINY